MDSPRSTMGQDKLNNFAIINIERAATNRVLQLQMNDIIDTFVTRKNRNFLLFQMKHIAYIGLLLR